MKYTYYWEKIWYDSDEFYYRANEHVCELWLSEGIWMACPGYANESALIAAFRTEEITMEYRLLDDKWMKLRGFNYFQKKELDKLK